VIQRSVQDHLATLLLEGGVHDGDVVRLGADAEGLTFSSGRRAGLDAA
jgi:ATP-dependent Clp protease ATP-binding subunit ClpA